jgi:uncharacterized membrane protein
MIDRDRQPMEFGRLLALSDGIFAFAMTLLVISIAVPAGLDRGEFPAAVAGLVPKVAIMALSIAVVGGAWITHHRLFGLLQRADERLVGLNIALLGMVAFVPLPHQVLGDYPHEPLAYVLYATVLGGANAMVVVMEIYVRRRNLLRITLPEPHFRRELVRGLTAAGGFGLSIPLAFVLVEFTLLIWVALLPLDRLIVRHVGTSRRKPPEGAPLLVPADGGSADS